MKPIPNFGGYCATEDGCIVSVRERDPKILKARIVDGYLQVTLSVCIRGRRARRRFAVHRLVLMAFKGIPPDEENVGRHLDGNSMNNAVENLAWGTHADNSRDAIRHGTLGPGMKAHRRKLTDDQVRTLLQRYADGESQAALAIEFGVNRYYPSQLARGKCWSHLTKPMRGGTNKV